ncbi:MAG: YfhO family protein, partial [Dehalococcoidia bacterium]|nr:YfhO family protein [Dehalococcoidia bacterium]
MTTGVRLRTAANGFWPALPVLAGLLFLFRGAIFKGLVFQEMDTLAYYYPVLTELRRSLLQGMLPLWTPYIYGGFPLFADGESGALYPINVLLLLLTSPEGALLWLGPIRLGLASLFMFLYARTIGLGRVGALVSTLVFGFGGFTIAQLHHLNLSSGALWLPLILFFIERAYRRQGRDRLWAVLLAGVAFALQGLALHVQVSLMTILFLAVYVAFRSLAFPSGALLKRVWLAAGALAGTVGLGLGLAAVQWLPLYELSRFSPRAPGLLYSQALEYSLPPVNLITLVSPYFFRGPLRVWWAVWSPWENAIYLGIAPLFLAAVALIWSRNRWTVFFGAGALLSLLVAIAEYLPLNPHYLLFRLPWFDALRAPGRFSYLFTFSMACLAGFGAHWLDVHREGARPKRFQLLPLAILSLSGALLLGLLWLQGWLPANRGFIEDTIAGFYLGLGPSSLSHLTRSDIYDFLRDSVGFSRWLGPVGLVLTSCAFLLAWGWLPRWRRLCVPGLVLLVAADLLWFAQDYHETIPVEKLAQESPAVAFLTQRAGSDRVFSVDSAVAAPNRLAPFRLQAAAGYSSLPFQRHNQYTALALRLERPLMDLWNVRYLVAAPKPSYAYSGLSFDPATPLFSGGGPGSVTQTSFVVPGVQAWEVRLLSTLRRAVDVPPGTQVGSLMLSDVSGSQVRLPILAGVHTADASLGRENDQPGLRLQTPQLAATLRATDPSGIPMQTKVYYASVDLPRPLEVSRVTVEYSYPSGSMEVYAVALVGADGSLFQVRPFYMEKFRKAYEGADGSIYEDTAALPRAFLVSRAVSLPNGPSVLSRLSAPDFDPRSEVLLEEQVSSPQGNAAGSSGRASITDYQDQRVKVETDSGEPAFLFLGDSYYPGWRAYVDAQEAHIYVADYLFRA